MSFGTPLLLLVLLAIPAVLLFAYLVGRRRGRYAVAFTNLEILVGLTAKRRRPARRLLAPLLFVLALGCAAVALAHPDTTLSQPQQNATIVMLVDVSGSMRANDVSPTRLTAAVEAMNTFLDRLPSQFQVGLVAFSDTAEPLVTPTRNRELVRQAVSYLAPQAGTAIGDGLVAATKMVVEALDKGGYVRVPGRPLPGAIVLLSDGAQNRGTIQPAQAAAMARKEGVRVYPVSLGTPTGTVSFGFGPFANTVPVPPDPATMAMIAQTTGGRSYTAQTAASVVNIYRTLGSSIGRTEEKVQITSWFAAAAALLLLASIAVAGLLDSRVP